MRPILPLAALLLAAPLAAQQPDTLARDSVHVPMLGVADSLNVSVTAAILFYEALRQRRNG